MPDLKGIELARPGVWQLASGKTEFTVDHLRDAAAFFTATGGQAIPLALGHNDPRFSGDPTFGSVRNVRYEEDPRGPVLKGDLVDMPEWLHAAAPTRWPNRSIEGLENFTYAGRTYRLVLTALALLGLTPPGVRNISSLQDLRVALTASAAQRIVATATAAHQPHLHSPGGDMTTKPWGSGDPVSWARNTGRITASSECAWRRDWLRDRTNTEHWLEHLQPFPDLARLEAASQYATTRTDASPPSSTDRYRNAVEELRARHPASVRQAEQAVPPPQLFSSGDYPTVTASGVNPTLLTRLPWRARLCAAWAKDPADVMRILEDYGGPDGEAMSIYDLSLDLRVADYTNAVLGWYGTAGVGDQPGQFDRLGRDEFAAQPGHGRAYRASAADLAGEDEALARLCPPHRPWR